MTFLNAWAWLVSKWKILGSIGVVGAGGAFGGFMTFLYKLREARARALKAESELRTLKEQNEREKAESHIKELALVIQQYADTVKAGQVVRTIAFSEANLAKVLGSDQDKLPQVLEYLNKERRAQKAFTGGWLI